MSQEPKDALREKLAQSRRLLLQTTDPATTETLRAYIEELEARMLTEMSDGPSTQAAQ